MSQAKAIPDGFHTITPHLVIKNAAEAMEWYKKAFGAEELGRTEVGGVIMHGRLRIGDSILMCNDEFPDQGVLGPGQHSPVAIHLYIEDVDTAYQRAVTAGATALMPPMDAFWGDRYGMLKDPYGHVWSLATHQEDLEFPEIEERARKKFGPSS